MSRHQFLWREAQRILEEVTRNPDPSSSCGEWRTVLATERDATNINACPTKTGPTGARMCQ